MKVQGSLRAIYDDRIAIYRALQSQVDAACFSIKKPRWHYESRVKALESFAIKVESGRVPNPERLEDFFAATFVVTNSNEIEDALTRISRIFQIEYRRPKTAGQRTKLQTLFLSMICVSIASEGMMVECHLPS